MFGNLARKLFGNGQESKSLAKNRLQMVLVQDRSGMSPKDMDDFKQDLIDVISKYFVTERKSVNVEWERENGATALIINMPVMSRHTAAPKAAVG